MSDPIKTLTLDEAQKELPSLLEGGCDTQGVVIVTADGKAYRMRIEKIDGTELKASKTYRGKPLYTEEDRLKMKSPYPNEPSWE